MDENIRITRDQLMTALEAALATYEDDQAWESADIVIEKAEAGGFMGSDSEYRPVDRREFAGRVLAALDRYCYFCRLLVHEPTDGRLLDPLPGQWHWAHLDCIGRADNDRRL